MTRMVPAAKSNCRATLTSCCLPSVTTAKLGRYPSWSNNKCSLTAPFRAPELRPIKCRHAQGNDGSIQTQQLVLETELPLLLARRIGHHLLTLLQQLLKHRLVQLPRPMLVGIRQGGTSRGGRQSQMLQFSFRCGQPSAYFAQRLCISQLTKQHGYELPPARETPRMALRSLHTHGGFKFQSRKKLQNLRENAAYSIQG